MTGWNLPPGCTSRDIEDAQGDEPVSYAPQVRVLPSREWRGNTMRFGTKAEAYASTHLVTHLLAVDARAVETQDAVTHRWTNEGLEAV